MQNESLIVTILSPATHNLISVQQKIFIFCMLQAPFIFMQQKISSMMFFLFCFFFVRQKILFPSDSKDNNADDNRLILYS